MSSLQRGNANIICIVSDFNGQSPKGIHYTVLYSTLLYSTLLYSTLLYSTLHSTLLDSTRLHYHYHTALYYTALYHASLLVLVQASGKLLAHHRHDLLRFERRSRLNVCMYVYIYIYIYTHVNNI